MVGTINRAGCVAPNCRWPIPAVLHVVAMVMSALAVGVAASMALPRLDVPIGALTVSLAAVVGTLVAFWRTRVWVASISHWQVPQAWRTLLGPYTLAVAYGLALGIPYLTRGTPVFLWAAIAYAIAVAPAGLAFILVGFAVGRAVPYLWAVGRLREFADIAAILPIQQSAERRSRGLAVSSAAVFLGSLVLESLWNA